MSEIRIPSNQPDRYDEARVKRLRPIGKAVEKLGLPPMRSHQIGGILNAIEMQIEVGGDSQEANVLLLDALRAVVRHQVGEHEASLNSGP